MQLDEALTAATRSTLGCARSSTTPPTSGASGWSGSRSSASTRRRTSCRAMHEQMKAERARRAVVTAADGFREAAITKAEGEKQAAILAAEGLKQRQILEAQGQAEAVQTLADAERYRAETIALGEGNATPDRLPGDPRRRADQRPDRHQVPRGAPGHRRRSGHQDLPAARHRFGVRLARGHRRAVPGRRRRSHRRGSRQRRTSAATPQAVLRAPRRRSRRCRPLPRRRPRSPRPPSRWPERRRWLAPPRWTTPSPEVRRDIGVVRDTRCR